ncbi:MAG: serine hydroxymethyltransferase [Parcubacteria group bacterium]|nr:serine hydroxymethyltransferase [Parcubacteria group bacterium]
MDAILKHLLKKEILRQKTTINLIASENYASPDVLRFLGSPLTNKYSEGYPGKRYYPGNVYCDKIEKLAQERALKVFRLKAESWGVNVQPYSGSPANLAIYFALLNDRAANAGKGEPKTDILGFSLSSGGHLTHGHKVNFSGKIFRAVQYGVDPKSGLIDYKKLEALAKKHRPKIIVSGATAYPRKIDFRKIGVIAGSVGAYHLADISHIAGLTAAGLHPSPFPHCDVAMTTTHKTLRGPRAAIIFSKRRKMIHNSALMLPDAIDRAVFPGTQGGPHENAVAAMAQALEEASKPAFKNYQKQIVKNAAALAGALKKSGFNLVTGGTDNHLLLIDLKNLGMDGLSAERRLEEAGITANRNAIIGDASPFRPSGIRLGTPAVTTRGMKEKEMKKIAGWIYGILMKKGGSGAIKAEIQKMLKRFPLPY